ncbi:MAG: patatin-like phospholipase family protein [Xanthomonadales bacterium]|jgi:predicted acylesterase/phospholipase RssA|nr:patatin-like phospholipase family protein [Xanthomonadales bacterium]
MLTLQSASQVVDRPQPRIGLAVAGGGPVGAIYELGALRALDESINGMHMHYLKTYVGVSAGAFIAASLANHVSTTQMCRIFMGQPDAELAFRPEAFLRPAYREYYQRVKQIPGIMAEAVVDWLKRPRLSGLSESLNGFSKAIPAGIFDNETINQFIEQVLNVPGRSNDFRELDTRLFVVAVDLDTGVAVRFGSEGFDHIPISRAVQASAALPGLYPPVRLEGRDYVDGALRRTLHASTALNEDIDLLIGVNPLVPYDAVSGQSEHQHLALEGLPLVLSQTFRALIQSRMKVGIGKYQSSYPNAGIMLLEPNRDDEQIFFTNVFSYSSRSSLCEHAYQTTRAELRSRSEELDDFLSPYGLSLNHEILNDQERSLFMSLKSEPRRLAPVTRALERALKRLDDGLGSLKNS